MKPTAPQFREFYTRHVGGLTAGDQAYGFCPFHADKKERSFSVNTMTGLWSCHRDCGHGNAVQFAQRLQLPLETVPGYEQKRWRVKAALENVFDYLDEKGDLLYQEVRWRRGNGKKAIFFQRPDGKGGFIKSVRGLKLVPYGLPELEAARVWDEPILIVEGPSKVEAVRKLGFAATCNPFGAGKWRPEFADYLVGCDIVHCPDNDQWGWSHVQKVAASLHGKAARIRVLQLPGLSRRGDVIDWVEAGGTAEEFSQLVHDAPAWPPPFDRPKPPPRGVRLGGFFQVPHWVFTTGRWAQMRPTHKAIYAVLCRRTDEDSKTCMPTLRGIAAESGVFWKSISEATDELETDFKVLRKKRRGNRVLYEIFYAPPPDVVQELKGKRGQDMPRNSAYPTQGQDGGTRDATTEGGEDIP